jgi:ATP-binding cassette subfamily C protein CydD
MRPLDPRLLRSARASRGYVVGTAGLGVLTAALVVGQAFLLARVIADVAMDGAGLSDVRPQLLALAAIVLARAAVAGAQERFGHRAATAVVRQLRGRLLAHVATRVGASEPTGRAENADSAENADEIAGTRLAVLATRGLDNLDGYLTRYLPQLLLAATLTPAVLVVIWWQDTIAGLTVVATLPLIPLFMALVGLSTQAAADRSLRTLQRLGAQVLDLIAGLPTLRALGRTAGPARRVREVGEAYRRATMRTLRSAFLSALVLETLTTLSVALIAVGIGLRLVSGGLDLRTGLTVLLLAPEVYLPLRQVGVHFHASVDGLAAAAQALAILELPVRAAGTVPAPDLRTSTVRFEGVRIVHPGADRATPDGLDAEVRPGEILALIGPSGVGKSSAVAALLGLRQPDAGRIVIRPDGAADVELGDVDPASWWAQLAWVPQHPALVPGTFTENVRLTAPQASQASIRAAARITGLDTVVAAIPGGWAAPVGQGGLGLSAGQRQRLALTRVLLSDAPLVILDEPTAHLDAGAERAVLAVLSALREAGRSVVLIAHRTALAALANRVAVVADAELAAELVS